MLYTKILAFVAENSCETFQ